MSAEKSWRFLSRVKGFYHHQKGSPVTIPSLLDSGARPGLSGILDLGAWCRRTPWRDRIVGEESGRDAAAALGIPGGFRQCLSWQTFAKEAKDEARRFETALGQHLGRKGRCRLCRLAQPVRIAAERPGAWEATSEQGYGKGVLHSFWEG
jgi:hypothetical protein